MNIDDYFDVEYYYGENEVAYFPKQNIDVLRMTDFDSHTSSFNVTNMFTIVGATIGTVILDGTFREYLYLVDCKIKKIYVKKSWFFIKGHTEVESLYHMEEDRRFLHKGIQFKNDFIKNAIQKDKSYGEATKFYLSGISL